MRERTDHIARAHPMQNRVDPFGRLIRTPARGAWMGNRGLIHAAEANGILHRRIAGNQGLRRFENVFAGNL